jgi:hypothetical protein
MERRLKPFAVKVGEFKRLFMGHTFNVPGLGDVVAFSEGIGQTLLQQGFRPDHPTDCTVNGRRVVAVDGTAFDRVPSLVADKVGLVLEDEGKQA